MPSTNPFTEEGRTRFRNFQRRLLTYFALWLMVGLGCTDEQVEPVLDERGKLIADKKTGPYFRLKPGWERKLFYWRVTTANDAFVRAWFEQNIYGGKSLLGLFYPSFAFGVFVVFAGTTATVMFDRRINRRYEKGERVRGTRSVMPKEYELESREAIGLGLEVFARKVKA